MTNYIELDDLIQTLVTEKNQATVNLLEKIINGVIRNPNVEKYRRLKVSGKAFSEKLLPVEGKLTFDTTSSLNWSNQIIRNMGYMYIYVLNKHKRLVLESWWISFRIPVYSSFRLVKFRPPVIHGHNLVFTGKNLGAVSFLYELGFEESADGEFYEVKEVNVDVIAKFTHALNRISELKSGKLGPNWKVIDDSFCLKRFLSGKSLYPEG